MFIIGVDVNQNMLSGCALVAILMTELATNGYKCKKNCSLSTTYNGEMIHRKQLTNNER